MLQVAWQQARGPATQALARAAGALFQHYHALVAALEVEMDASTQAGKVLRTSPACIYALSWRYQECY